MRRIERHANAGTLLHAYLISSEAHAVKAAPITGQKAKEQWKTSLLMCLFEHNTALMASSALLSDISCMEIVLIENGGRCFTALSPDTSNLTSVVHFQHNTLV